MFFRARGRFLVLLGEVLLTLPVMNGAPLPLLHLEFCSPESEACGAGMGQRPGLALPQGTVPSSHTLTGFCEGEAEAV